MRFKLSTLILSGLISLAVFAQTPAAPKADAPKAAAPKAATKAPTGAALTTDDEKAIYTIGLNMARTAVQLDLSPAEIEILKRGISDGAAKKPAIEATPDAQMNAFAQAREKRGAEKVKNDGKTYAAKAALEPGAVKSASGLVYKVEKEGTGASPKATDSVTVNYRGTFLDGKEFDSSYKRNMPASFSLNGVIPCWTEGVQKMKVGGKSRLVCPSDIAYGDNGRSGIPGGATLIFEIELLSIGAAAK